MELAKIHSLVMMWKLLHSQTPKILSSKLDMDQDYLATTTASRILLVRQSFRWRTITSWNLLPQELRSTPSLPS